MINTNTHPSYASIAIPSKPKDNNSVRNIIIATASLLVTFLTAYFLYSGYFVLNTGHVARIRLSSEPIIIEFAADNLANEGLVPGTKAWIQFHDQLMEDAGYNAQELRSNPEATVSFVSYDSVDANTDTIGAKNPSRVQDRPSAGITCFTVYTEIGNIGSQSCMSTRRITNPIRTGCSSRDGFKFAGAYPVGDLGCETDSDTGNVAARCCQPTPNSEYEGADWTVVVQTAEDTELGCTSVGCASNHVLVGCAGSSISSGQYSEFGGVQNNGNVCRAQRNNLDGSMTVGAMCASQPEDGHQLKCASVYSMTAKSEGPKYVSSVQCPVETVMFDCTSYLRGRIEDCADSSNTDYLYGEYYYKKKRKSKVYCKAVGGSNKVRAQATCCELE